MTSSFGQRLKAARVMRGLSMDRLVEATGKRISKQAISKYERDLMKPDSSVLIALCDALRLPADFFFQDSHIELTGVNFRKKSSLGEKSIASLKELVRDSLERYIDVESLLKVNSQHQNPLEGTSITSAADLEEAALRLRSAWGVGPNAPIADVIAMLEDHQVKVIEIADYDHFDGLSGRADDHPFVVLNSAAVTDRKRLTALHECAHLSLRFDEHFTDQEREKLCHGFAAAVLLPEKVLKRELGSRRSEISFYELGNIKTEYGISMQAVVQRAHVLGVISDHVYRSLNIEFAKRGWKKVEPIQLETQEHPFHFKQLVHRAYAEEVISISKGAYLAGMTIAEFKRETALDAENSPA